MKIPEKDKDGEDKETTQRSKRMVLDFTSKQANKYSSRALSVINQEGPL